MLQQTVEIALVSPESKIDDSSSFNSMEYYDIDSDASDYVELDDDEQESMTDDDLIEMSDTEKEYAKLILDIAPQICQQCYNIIILPRKMNP